MEFISLSDLSMTNNLYFTIFVVLISLFFFISSLIRFGRSISHSGHDKKTIPEASGSWPLLGHLPLLAGSVPPHQVLAKLADGCGPMFTLRLGIHRAIVVNSSEIAKECLTTHDRTFASRPKAMSSELLGYNYATVALSPYGPYWRQIRKISTVELLSGHRIELLKQVRESEARSSVKDAYEKWMNRRATDDHDQVDMNRWFGEMTLNIILRMIIGKRLRDGEVNEKERHALKEVIELVGRFVVSDAFPFLRWLDIGRYERAMRRVAKEHDGMLQRWLDEHKLAATAKGKLPSGDQEKRNQDFMDVMLSTLQDNNNNEDDGHTYDADTINKATCLTMVLAGSDTTTVTLLWTLSLLLNHKESLQKAQQELDVNIGRDRQVTESDLNNLPYLQAVIKEAMRLYPALPLSIPHESTEDCTLQGYFVPKGTRLLLNLYKIQRDPHVWPDPNEFKPERFLTAHKDFDVKRHNFELIPFGSGRRMCPGISLALPILGLSLASFLQAFEVKSPKDEPVDMTEAIGITNTKASPLKVLIKPRLPEFMYQ